MKLRNAARRFDRLLCFDAYSPVTPFLGQFGLYDDAVRDGLTVERRILSVDPDVVVPARRVISAGGYTWILGDHAPDFFNEEAIRHKYIVHQATHLGTIKTIQQALSGAAGTSAYMAAAWIKGAKQIEINSMLYDSFTIYMSATETVDARHVIEYGSRLYLVRDVYDALSGILAATSDELAEPALGTITLRGRTYSAVADSYTNSDASVQALRVRWQAHFDYLSQSSVDYERGDCQVMLPKTVTPTTKHQLLMSDGTWNVLSVIDEDTYWSVHARRA